MEGAILSTPSSSRFRAHLKNAATALCARTLPKTRCSEQSASSARHHTYPRTTPPKRAAIPCRMEPLMCELPTLQTEAIHRVTPATSKPNGVKLKGTFARWVYDKIKKISFLYPFIMYFHWQTKFVVCKINIHEILDNTF